MGEERTNDLHQVDWLEFPQESKIVKICIVPQRVVLGRKWPGVESLDIVDSRLRNVSGEKKIKMSSVESLVFELCRV
jgi:hypothetical protein